METPLVTVVIPVFNSEKFLKETLNSVIEQTYENWQCIVIDDGSTDSSLDIMRSFSSQDSRFQSVRRERMPKGVSVCRNIGIEAAKGKYLVFLDSDDLLDKSCLANRVHYMERHPALDFAVFQMEAFGLKSFLLTHKQENYLNTFLTFDFPWVVTSPIWKSAYLKNGIRFNEKLQNLEDPELHIRVLTSNPEFHVLFNRKPDCFYRQHRVYRKEKNSGYFKFIEGYAHFFNDQQKFKDLSKSQRKLMKNGFFRMVLNIIPPFDEFENNLFRQTVQDLKLLNVTGAIHHTTNKWWLWLINKVSVKYLEQMIVYFWIFNINPRKFVKDLIMPKINRKI